MLGRILDRSHLTMVKVVSVSQGKNDPGWFRDLPLTRLETPV